VFPEETRRKGSSTKHSAGIRKVDEDAEYPGDYISEENVGRGRKKKIKGGHRVKDEIRQPVRELISSSWVLDDL